MAIVFAFGGSIECSSILQNTSKLDHEEIIGMLSLRFVAAKSLFSWPKDLVAHRVLFPWCCLFSHNPAELLAGNTLQSSLPSPQSLEYHCFPMHQTSRQDDERAANMCIILHTCQHHVSQTHSHIATDVWASLQALHMHKHSYKGARSHIHRVLF